MNRFGKTRKQSKKVGDTIVHSGNTVEMGGDYLRIGHEYAKSTVEADGKRVFKTPTGKTFTVKKM